MWCWARKWFQPGGVRLSWRGLVLEIARWPVVLWAVINVLLRIKRPYMITPKGGAMRAAHRDRRLFAPYFAMASAGIAAVLAFRLGPPHTHDTQGYLALVLFDVAMVVCFLVAAVSGELFEQRGRPGAVIAAARDRAFILVSVGVLAGAAAMALGVAWTPMLEALA